MGAFTFPPSFPIIIVFIALTYLQRLIYDKGTNLNQNIARNENSSYKNIRCIQRPQVMYVRRDSLYVTYFPQKYLVGMNATKFRFIRTGDFMLKGII